MAEQVARPLRETDGPLTVPGKSVPPDVETELQALGLLSDDVLWAVARSRLNAAKQRRWRRLAERNQRSTLTEQEEQELARLMADGDRLMLCKAQAYLLLKERGHRIPELELRRTAG